MSKGSSFITAALALGAGALLGASVASQRDKLPVIAGPRPLLEGPQPLPALEVALGVTLVDLGGKLRGTVEQVPEAIRQTLGFAPVQIAFKEELGLPPNGYEVRLKGLALAGGTLEADKLLALGGADQVGLDNFSGEAFTDPATGRCGIWIAPEDEGRARLFGLDVLEAPFALALRVDTVLRRHLYEFLTREETYRLLERAKQTAPRTVEELVGRVEVGLVQKVLQNLLRELVSLRDLPFVLELISDAGRTSQDPQAVTEAVRRGLARQLSAALADEHGALHGLLFGPRLEPLRAAKPGDPHLKGLIAELRREVDLAHERGEKPILLAPAEARAQIRRLIERELPDLPVMSEQEIEPGFEVQPIGMRALEAH